MSKKMQKIIVIALAIILVLSTIVPAISVMLGG